MNKYANEHLSYDILDKEVKYYHKELYNKNIKTKTAAVNISDSNYVKFSAGKASTYPVFGEIVADRKPLQEKTSFAIFNISDNQEDRLGYIAKKIAEFMKNNPSPTSELLEKMRNIYAFEWDRNRIMHARMAATLDTVNPNSIGIRLFGSVDKSINIGNWETDIYKIVTKSLSIFDAIKLAREKVIVTEHNGQALAILNALDIPEEFNGILKFELHQYKDNQTTSFKTINFNLSQRVDGFVYTSFDMAFMIDRIETDPYNSDDLYFQNLDYDIPLRIDDQLVKKGEKTLLNKTSSGAIVEYNDDSRVYVQPFGLANGENVKRVTFLKKYTSFLMPSDQSYPSKLIFGTGNISYKDGFFYDALNTAARYEIDGEKVIQTNYGSGKYASIDKYFIDNDVLVDKDAVDIVFNDNSLKGYRLNNNIIVFSHENELFARHESDSDFTQLEFNYQVINGKQKLVSEFGGIIFIQQSETLEGQVYRNEHFIYDVDYQVFEGKITAEPVYGYAYPIDFFRIKRLTNSCGLSSDFPFKSYDNINNAKNIYNVGEISRILSYDRGEFSLINTIEHTENRIDTRYKAAFSFGLQKPAQIYSFGFIRYGHSDYSSHPEENWMSKKMKELDFEPSNLTYLGKIDQFSPGYALFWVAFKDPGANAVKLLAKHEYEKDGFRTMKIHNWMKENNECGQISFSNFSSKVDHDSNPNEFRMISFDVDNGIKNAEEVVFQQFTNTKSASSIGDGILSDLDISLNKVEFGGNSVGMYFVGYEEPSVMEDVKLFKGGPQKHIPINRTDIAFYAVPEIGMVFKGDANIEWFGEEYDISEIKDINKRGIRYSYNNLNLDAYLEYRASSNQLVGIYEYKVDENIIFSGEYELNSWDSIGTRADIFPYEQTKCIPMILSNKLYKEFGHTQCVAACWDESKNSVILPEDVDIHEEKESMGSKIVILKNGVAPDYIYDLAPIMNIHNGDRPYLMSDQIILKVSNSALITNINLDQDTLSQLSSSENRDVELLNIFASNFDKESNEVSITMSPVCYMPQLPWKNMQDYTDHIDKIMLDKELTFYIPKNRRLILEINVGDGNAAHLSNEMILFDEVYSYVDGFVSKEEILQNFESDLISTEHAYIMEYKNFYSYTYFLNRSIQADLDRYPNRLSYPKNNLLRELASPIREDALAKKMDGRSVAAAWDTRYIYEDVHTYSELVYELPTAFTCDSVPEESVLNRDHSNYGSFFKHKLKDINGEDLISTKGFVRGSIINSSSTDIEFSVKFDNKNVFDDRVSYPMDKLFFLYSTQKLWPTFEYNGRRNREKFGIRLIGSYISGGSNNG